MGILRVKHYPTKLFLKAADHTYVECGNGKKKWSCWGGKKDGTTLREAPGSTRRANKIAQVDERAGIKCYLINGVCHQAANRILLPAGITVRGARGYSISQAIFGPYGRIGMFPCRSPFNKYPMTTGDLKECESKKRKKRRSASIRRRSSDEKADWQYIQKVLPLYSRGEKLMKKRAFRTEESREINVDLFMIMADFELGPTLDKKLASHLKKLRTETEFSIEKLQSITAKDIGNMKKYVKRFNKITEEFQDNMANLLRKEEYEALFALKPEERILLADPEILKSEYSIDIKY